jgi:hypothetical protein
MIKKMIFSLLIGILITLWCAQDDPRIKNWIGSAFIRVCESALKCRMKASICKINFFLPSIELEQVSVEPQNESGWSWKAAKLTIQCSLMSLVSSACIDLYVSLKGLQVTTMVDDGKPAIVSYIQSISEESAFSMPIFLQKITITDASLIMNDTSDSVKIVINFDSDAKKIGTIFQITIRARDGALYYAGIEYINRFSGETYIDMSMIQQHPVVTAHGNGDFSIPQLDQSNQRCFYQLGWDRDHGILSAHTSDKSFVIDPIKISAKDNQAVAVAKVRMPASYVAQMIGVSGSTGISGIATMRILLNLHEISHGIHGNMTIEKCSYKNVTLFDYAKFSFSKTDEQWKGGIQLNTNHHDSIAGSWHYANKEHQGEAFFSNNNSIHIDFFKYWAIFPEDAYFSVKWDKDCIQGKYKVLATNATLDVAVKTSGILLGDKQKIVIQGTDGSQKYEGELVIQPNMRLRHFWYGLALSNNVFCFASHQKYPDRLAGSVSFVLMQKLLHNYCDYDVIGNGKVSLAVMRTDNNEIACNIRFRDNVIRLPHTYNSIKEFQAFCTIDWFGKKIVGRDILIKLHRGTIISERITCLFDSNFNPVFAHIPFGFESCLLDIKKDLFALLSGSFVYTISPSCQSLLRGMIIIERAQLNESLFSESFLNRITQRSFYDDFKQKKLFMYDFTIETKNAINVRTPFFQTQARANLYVSGTSDEPSVTGSVLFSGGTINFPYKPLYINKGSILFAPGHIDNPFIDLTAQNTIRNYHTLLRITGTRNSPLITFSSTPPLTEEQNIALLFTGSPEESLNIVMPALLMQNIKGMLWGERTPFLSSNSYFASLLTPLKRIHLLPRLSDQTGRGGLRGAIEIELSDRWRALIQQNFSLSEDTRFELEYLASDNISARVFRDERRDIGGELEIRWKR